jgi:alpha-glucosidase
VGILSLTPAGAQEPVRVISPDGRNVLTVEATEAGVSYSVDRDGRKVILPSRLGFEFRGAAPLGEEMEITEVARDSVDEVWEQPWGKVARVRGHHNELRISVAEEEGRGRRLELVFRLFDDGLGFRYRFPQQPGFSSFEITRELTEFRMADDARAWWIPANDSMRYEHLYSSSRVSSLSTVHTPLTMETQTGVHVVIHEAHLEDYAGMNLTGSGDRTLRVSLPT